MSIVDPPTTSQTLHTAGETPAWEIARLFPAQGRWKESDYLELVEHSGRLVEFHSGHIEVLELASKSQQRAMQALYRAMQRFVEGRSLGEVNVAPMPVRTLPADIREPDIFVQLAARLNPSDEGIQPGADLVVEVVSPDPKSWKRDWVEKRWEYAKAGFPEYWIVDLEEASITVLSMAVGKSEYDTVEAYRAGEEAKSVLISGFSVDVAAVLAGSAAL